MHYRFDTFSFDAHTLQLHGPQGQIPLRPMTARLLLALIEASPKLLGRDALLDQVWGRQAVSAGVVKQSIHELRQALGESAQHPQLIENLPRLGYRLNAVVQRNTAEAPAVEPDPASSTETPQRRPAAPLVLVLPVLAVVVVIGLLIWRPWAPVEDHGAIPARQQQHHVMHDGHPRTPQALNDYRRGLDASAQGDLHNARLLLEKSLAHEPDAPASMAALADILARAGNRRQALQWAQAADQAAAALPRVEQLRTAAFLHGLNYHWDEAASALQALFELNPGDADSGLRLTQALLAHGRLSEAETTLDRLAALPAPALDRFRLALMQASLATAQGNHRARLEAAEQALQHAASPSQRHQASLQAAWANLLLGQPDLARQRLDAPDFPGTGITPGDALAAALLRATLARDAGQFDVALAAFDHIAQEATHLGQDTFAARALREAAYVQIRAGNPADAIARLDTAIERLIAHGDLRELASARNILALAHQTHGDMDSAADAGQAALEAYIRAGDRIGEAAARIQTGTLLARSGRSDEAQGHWERAHTLFADIGDRRGIATALSNLAILHGWAGRADAARQANTTALTHFRELGVLPDVARLQFNMGVEDRGAGDLAQAKARFLEAIDAFQRVGARDHHAQAVISLAELHLTQADPASAAALLDQLETPESLSVQPRSALLTARARLAAVRGEYETAETGFRQALALREQAGLADWMRLSTLDLADLQARHRHLTQAEPALR
ncbi:tetratricopeptide repeat protein, partial [Castellaniella sp.]|uniref:tetratricopeptide repeat protein n=1 Tax=Castellaniella sp. TaxID=1955812 RepID=UPI0035679CE7